MTQDRSSEILGTVFQRRNLFRTAILSLSPPDREILVDRLAETLQKKAIDISGFVKLGGWPQVETWCAGDHLCVVLAETKPLLRSSSEAVEDLFRGRLAEGGPWQQLVFSLPPAHGPTAGQWLSHRIKAEEGRQRFLNQAGSPVLDELFRGEFLTMFAMSAKPL